MAMTLRLPKSEQQQFKKAAKAQGLSMQVAARTALREWVVRVDHHSRIDNAAELIIQLHGDALRRLGE
ncbi:MAG: hypothetical protein ACKOBR_04335 [Actinomycetota bacterium]|jgi:hypothetical protein